MTFKYILFSIAFLFCCSSFSQTETYEYLGVIKLNDSAFIPYKLAFEELDGKIEGFSVADLGGKHETKSNIIGNFNQEDKTFTFKEYDIVYTKSPITELDMCLVNFKGKMRNLNKSKAFSGDFKGFYPDESACLNGMIIMSASDQVKERIEKMDRKIQKSKKVSQEIKDKISAKRAVDTLTMSIVKKDENLNIFTKTKKVMVSIYDSGKVDNDRINLYVDDVLVLGDYSIEKTKKQIPIDITKPLTVVRVEALDEGTSAPNTVKVEIQDGPSLITTRTSLKTGEKAELTLVKQ
ncbi:hypothetical protein [Dokdonia sp. Hel_I_53]|uniref:hypothetical protein n=1 Tax=Dokdonia sp. Hel_I_53 TaxID=1566287 RepID=UPI00119BFB27|nr:hypothetical protein [Dokdonia sp. Hel_I_53]TVZ52828.1 hypothetical protein OD90_2012 [Dokdonia sp. Hel_I_53]